MKKKKKPVKTVTMWNMGYFKYVALELDYAI
jgi:hypothetical protein